MNETTSLTAYISGPNTYYGNGAVDTANAQLTKTYLDDGERTDNVTVGGKELAAPPNPRGWQIRLENIPYKAYDLYLIVASDDATADSQDYKATPFVIKVDGGEWTYVKPGNDGEAVASSNGERWDAYGYSTGEMVAGKNYVKIRVTPDTFFSSSVQNIELTHAQRNNSDNPPKVRGSIAAIQIRKIDWEPQDLTWGGVDGKAWNDADAWKIGDTLATFKGGDTVKFPAFEGSEAMTVSFGDHKNVLGGLVFDSSSTAYTLTGSGALATPLTTMTSGKVTLEGTATYDLGLVSGAGEISVAQGSTVSLRPAETSLGTKLSGAGTICLTGQMNTTKSILETYLAEFSGVLEVSNERKLYFDENADYKELFASQPTIRLDNDIFEVADRDQSYQCYATIEVTANGGSIVKTKTNFTLKGRLKGEGVLNVNNTNRGTFFEGDNSGFSGVLNLTQNASKWCNSTFKTKESGSANACWNLLGDSSNGGFYISPTGTTKEDPIHFGALNVEKAASNVEISNANTWIAIGERADETSTIRGQLTKNPVNILKKGENSTLWLSDTAKMVAGSTIDVEAGRLMVKATDLTATVTVRAGATIQGTGTIDAATFEKGAQIAIGDDKVTYPAEEPTEMTIIEGLKVKAFSGFTPKLIGAPETRHGYWRLKVTKDENDVTTFSAKYSRTGFMLILR